MARRSWTRRAEPGLLTPAQFLALPAQPDGTVVRVQVDAAAGINWRFRFNAGSANAAKWEWDGGGHLTTERSNSDTVVANVTGPTFVELANEPSVMLPLVGDYDAEYETTLSINNANAFIGFTLKVGGVAVAPFASAPGWTTAATGTWIMVNYSMMLAGAAAGAAVKSSQATLSAGTLTGYRRRLRVRPSRVQGP